MISRFGAVNSVLCLLIHYGISESHLRGGTEPAENLFQTALIDHPAGNFAPLECNADLNQAECQPWSSLFGADGNTMFNRKMTVPCGQCVEIDHKVWGRDLVFRNGLDVQGKLVFPPNSHLKVKTTSILVQGELHMYSSKAINGIPAVTVTWIDPVETPPRPISFRPPTTRQNNHTTYNSYPCGKEDFQECNMGERPFVVAGGKVVIQGLPSQDTPSWVPLLDVDDSKTGWHVPKSEYQQYVEEPLLQQQQAGCPLNGKILHHTFTEPTPNYISASWGAFAEWTGESLKMTRRSHADHGFIIDTREIRQCLSSKQSTYLVTAKVRIPRGLGLSQCATTGKNCMKLMTKHRKALADAEEEQTVHRWVENESHRTEYGKEIIIHTYIQLVDDEFDETNVYHIFHLQGPGPGEDFELLEFTMELPPREAFADPDKICANLVPANGNAEVFPFSPFPFRTNSDYVQIQTATEHSNRYFQVTGREVVLHDEKASTADDADRTKRGITWSVPPSCVKAKATYRFRAKVRVHSDTPVTIEWNVRGSRRNMQFARVARCPPSQGQWVQCRGGLITLPNDIVHSHHLSVVADTLDTSSVDYDVDDISFELVDGPVDRLILPSTIRNQWVKGAHLLITSQSPAWDAWEVVQIKEVSSHDDESVKVEISRPIQSPVTAKDSRHYATEVALLSRNILFEHGGHFTILHTPNVPQIIEGADFDGWGVAGVRDRYPIHFDNCQNMKGTVVAKNTIRHSRQRGIVLHATDNVRVEANVAFNVTGHCFALESGLEQRNVFEDNLSVYNQAARSLMPQMGASDKETDDTPAMFWITNPMNDYIGNVATGSEGYGFWLQLRETPRGPHSQDAATEATHGLALGIFENNVVHSVRSSPIRVSGYHPISEAKAKIVGLKVYWNDADSLEIADSESLAIINGIFDKPLVPSPGLDMINPSIIDILGCDDEDDEAAMVDALAAAASDTGGHPTLDTPSAPSVFGLQEFETLQ
jgi:hypothetical protein